MQAVLRSHLRLLRSYQKRDTVSAQFLSHATLTLPFPSMVIQWFGSLIKSCLAQAQVLCQTIIEADSINTQPLTVDSIQIFAGQRYSFVLNTNQPVSNYWIRADPNLGTIGFGGGINSAILRYWGAPKAEPNTTSTSTNPLNEVNLRPLANAGAPGVPTPGKADVNLVLNIAIGPGGKFTINGASFTPPSVPALLQILSGANSAQDLLPTGSVYTLPPNKVIELTIPGAAVAGPVSHLTLCLRSALMMCTFLVASLPSSRREYHSLGLCYDSFITSISQHAFDVVRSVGSSTYNFANPVRRDVVSTGTAKDGDNVTIRFKTDNPGPWILHW